MKEINMKSPEIIHGGGRKYKRFYITVEPHRIYFTAAVTRELGLAVGLFVHFLNEDKVWDFYVNDNPDGFKLTIVTKKGGFHITNSALSNMILNSLGHKIDNTKRLAIVKTGRYLDSNPIYNLAENNIPKF